MTVQRASIHNTTQNPSDNLPSYLQTNIGWKKGTVRDASTRDLSASAVTPSKKFNYH